MALIWARATSGLSNLPRPDAYHQAAEAADVKHTADAYRTAAAGDPACAPTAAVGNGRNATNMSNSMLSQTSTASS
jgi:hypothetical protein